jgi:hypothetical protein
MEILEQLSWDIGLFLALIVSPKRKTITCHSERSIVIAPKDIIANSGCRMAGGPVASARK